MNVIAVTNGYTYPVHHNLEDLERNTDVLAGTLNELYGAKPIGLVCQGTSGVLIATRTAAKLKVPCDVHLIRKGDEDAHTSRIRMCAPYKPLVIVDDLISSGATLRRIYEGLAKMSLMDGVSAPALVEMISIGGIYTQQVPEHYFPNLKYLLP